MSTSSNKDALTIDTADISVIDGLSTGKTISSSKSLKRDVDFIDGISRTDDKSYYLQNVNASSDDEGGGLSMGSTLNKGMMLSKSNISGLSADSGGEVNKQDSQAKPRLVLVSFKVNNVSDIDVVRCTFNANVSLFFHWEDPTLIGRPLGKLEKKDLDFHPEIMVINSLDLQETEAHYRLELINTYTGAVKESRHFRGRVHLLSLDLFTFPFDCQNLSINLRSKRKDFNALVLEYFSEESTVDAHPQHDWIFHGYTALAYTTLPKYSTTGKIYSSLHVVVQVQRHAGWFVNNVMIPFFALTVISWASYALPDHAQHPAMYNITMLTLLASLANKLIVFNRLPQVPYRTMIDWYVDTSFLCQVLSLGSAVIRDWYSDDSSTSLRYGLLGLNAGIFALFHIVFLWRLRVHGEDVQDWRERANAVTNAYDLAPNSSDGAAFAEQGLNFAVGEGGSQVSDSNLGVYAKLGLTKGRGINKLERFGLNQTLLLEEEEEEDEEEEKVTISGGKVVTNKDSDNDIDNGNVSPSSRQRKRMSLQKEYEKNLARVHSYRESRPVLAARLSRRGMNVDYAKPQIERLLASGTLDGASARYGELAHVDSLHSGSSGRTNVRDNAKGGVQNWGTGTGGTLAPSTQRAETTASILIGGTGTGTGTSVDTGAGADAGREGGTSTERGSSSSGSGRGGRRPSGQTMNFDVAGHVPAPR